MESYLLEWLNLLGRWIHMITGVAWIGASFYFVWLDNHLLPPKDSKDSEQGVGGEVWSVHGGGFYHAQKYKVSPPKLPETLHWFKWEAYSTWLSGMFLLVLMYWYSAEIYTIDPGVATLTKPIAILIGLSVIVGGWLVYDLLCKSKVGQNDLLLGAVIALFVSVVAYYLCQYFSGRAAFIHFGAMLGTIMVANVFFIIIPGQKELVSATREGRIPDSSWGVKAKQRSVHNTFFTLPVLFVMISNHYAMTYGHELNWLILIGICIAGGCVRIYFVQKHFGKASPLPIIGALIILALVAYLMVPKTAIHSVSEASNVSETESVDGIVSAVSFDEVFDIMEQRCTTCHSQNPTQAGFATPPRGIVFDTPEQIVSQATLIYQQTVSRRTMPIGNLTQMTEEERERVDLWYQSGAKSE